MNSGIFSPFSSNAHITRNHAEAVITTIAGKGISWRDYSMLFQGGKGISGCLCLFYYISELSMEKKKRKKNLSIKSSSA